MVREGPGIDPVLTMTDDTNPPEPPEPGPEDPTREQPAPERPTTPQPEPRRLYRSRSDKVIAGVCSGIANYFRIDPVIVRVLAVALIFLGGAGVFAYIAAWLLMPVEGEGGGPAEGPSRVITAIGAILLVIAI